MDKANEKLECAKSRYGEAKDRGLNNEAAISRRLLAELKQGRYKLQKLLNQDQNNIESIKTMKCVIKAEIELSKILIEEDIILQKKLSNLEQEIRDIEEDLNNNMPIDLRAVANKIEVIGIKLEEEPYQKHSYDLHEER